MPRGVKCPTCRAETVWDDNPHRPFCSKRCYLIDLGAWLDERYRIPGKGLGLGAEDDEDEDDRNSCR